MVTGQRKISVLAMAFLCVALALFFPETKSMAESIGITANVLKRVVRVVVGTSSGTAFTIDVDDKQYLVTAKHVVATLRGDDGIVQVCGAGGECTDKQVSILRCDDPVDIAVLVPKELLTVTYPLPASSKNMFLGQDVYFVGFPYADQTLTTTTSAMENVGFVRKAIWSAQERKDHYIRMYFDGRNNSGFSGSPIVFLEAGRPRNEFKVAAVVSGYRTDYTDVMGLEVVTNDQISEEDRALNKVLHLADGTYRKLSPTGLVVPGNTGIVIAYDIGHAVDLIRKSGLRGPPTKQFAPAEK